MSAVFLMVCLISFQTGVFAAEQCEEGQHVFQTKIIDATDTRPGSISYTCEICGYSYQESIPPYGHNFSKKAEKADCENPGRRIYTCKVCGYTYEETYGKALGHQYESYIKTEPTAEREGVRVYRCIRCGREYSEIIPFLKPDDTAVEEEPEEPEEEETAAQAIIEQEETAGEKEDAAALYDQEVNKTGGSSAQKKTSHVTENQAPINYIVIMIGSLELLLLIVLLPDLFICFKLIAWHKKRSDEYRKHHIRWKERV